MDCVMVLDQSSKTEWWSAGFAWAGGISAQEPSQTGLCYLLLLTYLLDLLSFYIYYECTFILGSEGQGHMPQKTSVSVWDGSQSWRLLLA